MQRGDEGMASKLTLPVRSTRGKRMSALIGEAEEADKEFWNQDFFAEETRDQEYEKSDSETSVYDSDFDDKEDHGDEDGDEDSDDEERRERLRKKKKLLPPGRAKPKPKAQAGPGSARPSSRRRSTQGVEVVEIVRKSSRASVMEATARHEEHKRMQQVEQRIRKFKRESESFSRPKTMAVGMEDLLKESCLLTEVHNSQSLNYLLEREEEAKRRHAVQSRKVYTGPKVKYHSFRDKDGLSRTELVYTGGAQSPSEGVRGLVQSPPSAGQPPKCEITGKPARYRDPLSGLYFSSVESFKEVRARKPQSSRLQNSGRPPKLMKLKIKLDLSKKQ
ncbi:YL1 domain-containing protein [Chloropicon primus]|uniref:YL1 domain-containing protein n=1 Tax=Chloropicon primus TaxID=1764295 RepID=A0A5B8MU56_9CHLO|nr:YL1 domain-containing protein [Chloropicon primus]UPR02189.1 YL1 domain-containing protein [Chloropicon primus]|mmetsp:Transcript_10308/g.29200  ORF Transcript_10308/g.29200 Transcript_10308/m.29200 type:complete len:333 (-) Transcript_10308:1699-2697(-)|eukprot:QDZ22972.1 YL1 domain-containing protein [Chloropicon primus]